MSELERSESLSRIVQWFENLTVQTLSSIDCIYAAQAHFKDPFNDVVGAGYIRAIYSHMFENLTDPAFEITQTIEQGQRAFVAWRFTFQWRGKAFDIPGCTQMTLNQQGLIVEHVDYWDVAQGIYEHLPLLGAVLRKLRQRMVAVVST